MSTASFSLRPPRKVPVPISFLPEDASVSTVRLWATWPSFRTLSLAPRFTDVVPGVNSYSLITTSPGRGGPDGAEDRPQPADAAAGRRIIASTTSFIVGPEL